MYIKVANCKLNLLMRYHLPFNSDGFKLYIKELVFI